MCVLVLNISTISRYLGDISLLEQINVDFC